MRWEGMLLGPVNGIVKFLILCDDYGALFSDGKKVLETREGEGEGNYTL